VSPFSALVAFVIAVGVAGIVIPLLPGAIVVLAAIVVWGLVVGGTDAWLVVAAAVGVLLAAQVLKYLVPGRRLRDAGVPRSTLAVGAVVGVVGFFVIPVVGLVVGFVAGVYAAEHRRLGGSGPARAATASAIRAVGLSVAIEMTGALLGTGIWAVGAVRLT
jgi:uncharacterized protein YqgC (DUF456 family)